MKHVANWAPSEGKKKRRRWRDVLVNDMVQKHRRTEPRRQGVGKRNTRNAVHKRALIGSDDGRCIVKAVMC